MVLIILSGAWVAGFYLGSLMGLSPWLIFAGLFPLAFLSFKNSNRKKVIVVSLAIFLLTIGAVYAHAAQSQTGEGYIRFYNDSGPVVIKGTVSGDPDIRDKSTRLTLEVNDIHQGDKWQPVQGKTLVTVYRYPEFHYGDILQIQGKPETPPQLDGFDYRGYLEHQGIATVMSFPKVEVLGTGGGSAALKGIYGLRARMAQTLGQILPEPQSSLAQGILLGLRGNIPDDLNAEFSRSGTTHLLAISGYNLSVMAGILLAAGIWLLGRRYYLYVWLAMGAIWFYTVITGFNPPVVRGAVMASIFLVAEALGRQRSAAAALALAAAVMAGLHPYILGDASFQLSFMAMAGLVFIHPVISGWAKQIVTNKLGEDGWYVKLINLAVDAFSVSVAAILAVWPLIAYYFGTFSLTGPLATFLLTPVQPVIIVVGMLAALGGLAWGPIAQIFGWLLWPFLQYMIRVVQWLGSPGAAIDVGWMNPVFIAGYYLVLALAIWAYGRLRGMRSLTAGAAGLMKAGVSVSFGNTKIIRWLIVPVVLLALLTTFTAAAMPDDKLKVSFLDVGEGDATLVQKGCTQILIDGGPSPQAINAALSREMPFWDRTIDVVILTHPHEDHLAGLVEVLKRYTVNRVIYPASGYASPAVDEWQKILSEKHIDTLTAQAGQQIKIGGDIFLDILNPPEALLTGTESDVDNNSVVVNVHDGEISFLITGDMMKEAERILVWSRADITCTVLKAAHHGSDTSSTAGFLAVANPEIAVISCGAGNKYGHPDAAALGRLEEAVGSTHLYRTDLQGAIDFTTDGTGLWVKTEK